MSEARQPGPRLLPVVIWTAALAALLFSVDRLALGPAPHELWTAVASPSALPTEAGPAVVPSYLPGDLGWPPAVVLLHAEDAHGFWMGLTTGAQSEPSLWIGTGLRDTAAAIGPAAACLSDTQPLCPQGWRALSTEVAPGQGVNVIGSLPPIELRRIVEGLRVE